MGYGTGYSLICVLRWKEKKRFETPSIIRASLSADTVENAIAHEEIKKLQQERTEFQEPPTISPASFSVLSASCSFDLDSSYLLVQHSFRALKADVSIV